MIVGEAEPANYGSDGIDASSFDWIWMLFGFDW
jgi:hypothetical protein